MFLNFAFYLPRYVVMPGNSQNREGETTDSMKALMRMHESAEESEWPSNIGQRIEASPPSSLRLGMVERNKSMVR